jgi:hypothetical protein
MAIKLIAMDLDGTLLNSGKRISERNLAAIRAAAERGVGVTIATGRMYMAAAYFGREISANVPLICCNGTVVQAIDTDVPLFIKHYDANVVRDVLTLCHDKGWYAQWYIGNNVYAEDFRPKMFKAYQTVEDFHVIEVGNDFLSYTENVIQIVIRNFEGEIPAIVKQLSHTFEGKLRPQQNTGVSVDLTPPGMNKAVGLEKLMQSLGLTPNEVMVCGDADNDLEMLEFAGLSIVTANGLPQAKALADFVTDSCDKDGVGKAIERFVLV